MLLGRVLYYLLGFTVAIDFISGFLSNSIFGQIVRVVLYLICMYFLLRFDLQSFCIATGILLYCFVVMSASVMNAGLGQDAVLYEAGIIIKLQLFYVVYKALVCGECKGFISEGIVHDILKISAFYVPLLYLGSLIAGLGAASYSGGEGFRSVFMSLNSVNFAMLILYAYSTWSFFTRPSARWAICALLNAISLILLGTKSSIVFVFLLFIAFLLISKEHRVRNILVSIFVVVVFLTALNSIDYVRSSLDAVLVRQEYLFKNRSFLDYLTSGRTWMYSLACELFDQYNNPISLIFGHGYYVFHHDIAVASGYLLTSSVRPIEFDWADIYFSYGIVGTLFVYGCFCSWVKKMKNENRSTLYILLFGVCLIFSSLAGHVVFEGISSVFLGLVLAGGIIEANQREVRKEDFTSTL